MKKNMLASYIYGITDPNGESYHNIFKYFLPELITAFVLYSALCLLDAHWIGHLKSTSAYATLGVTNQVIHFLVKVSEGLSVGSIILCGQYNGAGFFKRVGNTVNDAFWLTFIIGIIISSILFFGAHWIYILLGVPKKMLSLGVPFLKLRAIGIFFTFLYFAFIGFLRGIKNTRTPMQIFIVGAIVFIFFDYALIFGKFGFPEMKLNGSALATVVQYSVMFFIALCVVLFNKEYRKYGIHLFSTIKDLNNVKLFLILSLPVVIDKATMAAAYIWLGKMIAPMGKNAIASFSVIKDLDRLAFLPAVAFAQVITLLVSNDFGASNFVGIKSNIKKVLFLASIFVLIIILILMSKPKLFIQFFDKKGAFTDFSAKCFHILGIFIFFDLLQLILSGALRAIGAVKLVMYTRVIICFSLFFPLSYLISQLAISNQLMKFVLIFGIFYISNGIMCMVYINKFRSYSWKKEPDSIQSILPK